MHKHSTDTQQTLNTSSPLLLLLWRCYRDEAAHKTAQFGQFRRETSLVPWGRLHT